MEPGSFFTSGMWIVPIVMMLAFALIFRFVVMGRRPGISAGLQDAQPRGTSDPAETPLQILQKRYARGEISENEFESMKRKL